jgi:hypothetical protein
MNLTLVAYYGPKTDEAVKRLLETIQDILDDVLKSAFERYDIRQVHGTIIGLEGTRASNAIINTNFVEKRQSLRAINLERVLEIADSMSPFDIRIGGYKDGAAYPFTSRGLHPYLRSFSIQGDKVVAMGWPVETDKYPLRLERLRKKFNEANVLHAYHDTPESIDNDFYFVLGNIKKTVMSELALQQVQEVMREAISELDPVLIRIDKNCLGVVAYPDTRLPWSRCEVFSLENAKRNISNLIQLYDELPAP